MQHLQPNYLIQKVSTYLPHTTFPASWFTSPPLHDELVISRFVEPVWENRPPGEVSWLHDHQARLGQQSRRHLAQGTGLEDELYVGVGQVQEFSRREVQVVGACDWLDGLCPRGVEGPIKYQPEGFAWSLSFSATEIRGIENMSSLARPHVITSKFLSRLHPSSFHQSPVVQAFPPEKSKTWGTAW